MRERAWVNIWGGAVGGVVVGGDDDGGGGGGGSESGWKWSTTRRADSKRRVCTMLNLIRSAKGGIGVAVEASEE